MLCLSKIMPTTGQDILQHKDSRFSGFWMNLGGAYYTKNLLELYPRLQHIPPNLTSFTPITCTFFIRCCSAWREESPIPPLRRGKSKVTLPRREHRHLSINQMFGRQSRSRNSGQHEATYHRLLTFFPHHTRTEEFFPPMRKNRSHFGGYRI